MFTIALIGVLYWFFGTELGSSIRSTGANPHMARAQGINTNFNVALFLTVPYLKSKYTHPKLTPEMLEEEVCEHA